MGYAVVIIYECVGSVLLLRLAANAFSLHSSHVQAAWCQDRHRLGLGLLGWEHIPEPQSLVARTGYDSLTVGTRREVKHTVRVAGERCKLPHGWVLP